MGTEVEGVALGGLKTFFNPLGDHCTMSPFCDMSWSYSFRTRAHFFMVIRPQEKAGLESEGQE